MKKYKWKDIDIICEVDFNEYDISFKMFEIVGASPDILGNFTKLLFEKKGAESIEDTHSTEEAQTIINGTIKSDCCSHIYFGDNDGYIHVCGGRSWRNLIEAQKRIFKIAREYFNKAHQIEGFNEYDEKMVNNWD